MSNTYDMTGAKKIFQGSDKEVELIVKSDGSTPDDLTGFKARMMIRQSVKDDAVLDELTTENDRIVITPGEGKVVLKFPSSVTMNYDFTNAVYDLELVSDGDPEVVTRLLQGVVEVDLEVTR